MFGIHIPVVEIIHLLMKMRNDQPFLRIGRFLTLSLGVLSSPGMSMNFAYLWALARLQHGVYQKHKSDGPSALPDYNYDVDSAVLFGGCSPSP